MYLKFLIFFAAFLVVAHAENVGWQSYLDENPTEFHDIPLEWEGGDQTLVPSWLSGIFVRNGPAQVHKYISEFQNMGTHIDDSLRSATYSDRRLATGRRASVLCMHYTGSQNDGPQNQK